MINKVNIFLDKGTGVQTLLYSFYCSNLHKDEIYNKLKSIIQENYKEYQNIYKILNNDKDFDNNFSNELYTTLDYVHNVIIRIYGICQIDYHIFNKYYNLIFYKNIILNIPEVLKGNCVDDFIIRGIEPNIKAINKYCEDILQRNKNRKITNEYHQTSCYEADFSEIINIKKIAEKIIKNCNRQLEALSEKYTKL